MYKVMSESYFLLCTGSTDTNIQVSSWCPTQLPSHLAQFNIHNWMTHSWQFTESIQSVKSPMRANSPLNQIKPRILMACLSSTKWQITKLKYFNNFALWEDYLIHTFLRAPRRGPSTVTTLWRAQSRSRPWKSGSKSPLFPCRISE